MKNFTKLATLALIIYMILTTFNSTASYSDKEELNRIKSTISELCLKCYSIEGRYPSDIKYLEDYYGLLVNEDDYQLVYYFEGDNIPPEITVFKKGTYYE